MTDDEVEDRRVLAHVLTERGHQVQAMLSGQAMLTTILRSIRELQEINRHLLAKIEHMSTSVNEIAPDKPVPAGERFIRDGAIAIDVQHCSATLDGRELDLTTSEFDLLVRLVSAAPSPVLAVELVSALGYRCTEAAENIGQWHIHNLRKKVGTQRIKTLRGKGYVWVG